MVSTSRRTKPERSGPDAWRSSSRMAASAWSRAAVNRGSLIVGLGRCRTVGRRKPSTGARAWRRQRTGPGHPCAGDARQAADHLAAGSCLGNRGSVAIQPRHEADEQDELSIIDESPRLGVQVVVRGVTVSSGPGPAQLLLGRVFDAPPLLIEERVPLALPASAPRRQLIGFGVPRRLGAAKLRKLPRSATISHFS